MSSLITFYDDSPVKTKGRIELRQQQMTEAVGLRSSDGVVRAAVVYVEVTSEAGPFLVPFGDFDEWSLRDRYNEAIRIMNTLGASTIVCETFGEVTVRRNVRARVLGRGGDVTQQRIENSGFDFQHDGAGSAPRDPRPLRWPDEPGFAAAVSSVLDNGARDVQINIRSNRTYSLDGSLATELRKCRLELGGSSQRTGTTSLHIRATFPQIKRGWG